MNPKDEGLDITVVHIIVEESVQRITSRQNDLNEMLDASIEVFRFASNHGYSKDEILASQATIVMSNLGDAATAELLVGLLVTAVARLAEQEQ